MINKQEKSEMDVSLLSDKFRRLIVKLLTGSVTHKVEQVKNIQRCTNCGSEQFVEVTKYDEQDEKAERPIEYYWECLKCGNKDYTYIPF